MPTLRPWRPTHGGTSCNSKSVVRWKTSAAVFLSARWRIHWLFFDVSYQSYLPSLVTRADVIEGNSKLEVTRSVGQLSGPAIAGFLIQLIGAAQTIWVDAGSYVFSVASLLAVRKPEPEPRPSGQDGRSGFWLEMREGVQMLLANATLSKIAGSTATSNLGTNLFFAVFLIYAYRLLHLAPGMVGLVFAVGPVGGVLGAVVAGTMAKRVGLGITLLLTIVTIGVASFLVPLAEYGLAIPLLIASGFVSSFVTPVYNINAISLRQVITPDRFQGRVNATVRTIVWGTIPIGSLLGGILGSSVGIVPTLWIGAAIATMAGLWILAGPIRLKEQPEPVY